MLLGERICSSPEAFKAWSQNLGHEQVLTTFTSYGAVSDHRQAEIMQTLRAGRESGARQAGAPDAEAIRRVLAHLKETAV